MQRILQLPNNAPDLANEDKYYNITLVNDTSDKDILAQFTEEKIHAILDDQSQYKMSIIRFDIPTDGAPILVYDDDLDPYKVTVRDDATGVIGEATFKPIQTDFSTGLILSTPNFVKYYQSVIESFNNALEAAWVDFINNWPFPTPASPFATKLANYQAASGTGMNPFYVIRDVESQLTTIYALESATDDAARPLQLWMNNRLQNLFVGWYSEFYGYNQPNDQDFRVKFIRMPLNYNLQTYNGNDYLFIKQEINTSAFWYDTYKIVIVSKSMHARFEGYTLTDKNEPELDSIEGLRSGGVTKLGVITDINYEFSSPNIERISYSPDQFRWIDLLSPDPLTKLDFQIFLQTKNGSLRPVYLTPGDSMNIKLLFRKK